MSEQPVQHSENKKDKQDYSLKKGLSRRHILFCQYYASGDNGTDSAKKAGFSKQNPSAIATYLLKKPEIIDRIRLIEQEQIKTACVTYEVLINKLVIIAEESHKAKAYGHAIKALETIARMQGFLNTTPLAKSEIATDETQMILEKMFNGTYGKSKPPVKPITEKSNEETSSTGEKVEDSDEEITEDENGELSDTETDENTTDGNEEEHLPEEELNSEDESGESE